MGPRVSLRTGHDAARGRAAVFSVQVEEVAVATTPAARYASISMLKFERCAERLSETCLR